MQIMAMENQAKIEKRSKRRLACAAPKARPSEDWPALVALTVPKTSFNWSSFRKQAMELMGLQQGGY